MKNQKTIFVAGASGAIGKRLCRILVKDGWSVVGTTRYAEKKSMLEEIGVEPVIVDVFDEKILTDAIHKAQPEIVIHQLTDLPFGLDPEKMEEALIRNARLRETGTRNLVTAATQAGATRMIAQSIAFVYEPGQTPYMEESPLLNFEDPAYGMTAKAVASLEQQVLEAPFEGVVLRYGLLYGPGTGFDQAVPDFPPVHVDAAAKAASLAIINGTPGIYNVAEDTGIVNSKKAADLLRWNAGFRLE
jgi:nucleoside-diphosphate-sugar epimerase